MAKITLALFGIAMLAVALTGCGTTRDSQTKTVEREELIAGPLVVDSPVGQLTIQPTRIVRLRTQDEVTQEEKRINMPEAGAIMSAAANATPWGGIIGAITTAGMAAFAGKKAIEAGKATRHRNELIDGIERASAELPDDHWETLTKNLAIEQSADTKQAVKERVG